MKNLELFDKNGYTCALSNICTGRASVMDLEDAVEDSNTARELEVNVSNLDIRGKFRIDRITPLYVRLKGVDGFGNIEFLKAYF